jgi:hypothetical protein
MEVCVRQYMAGSVAKGECLLSFNAESLVFWFVTQEFKD